MKQTGETGFCVSSALRVLPKNGWGKDGRQRRVGSLEHKQHGGNPRLSNRRPLQIWHNTAGWLGSETDWGKDCLEKWRTKKSRRPKDKSKPFQEKVRERGDKSPCTKPSKKMAREVKIGGKRRRTAKWYKGG